jgi:phosphatidylserine synthase
MPHVFALAFVICVALRPCRTGVRNAIGNSKSKGHQQHIGMTNLVACCLLLQLGLDTVHLGRKLVSLLRCTHSIGPACAAVTAAKTAG